MEGWGAGQQSLCHVRVLCKTLFLVLDPGWSRGQFEAVRKTGKLNVKPSWRKGRREEVICKGAEIQVVPEPSASCRWRGSDGRVDQTRPRRMILGDRNAGGG